MRRRYFVIGKFNAEDNFILDKIKSNLSKERMTLRNYLKNTSLELDTDYYYMHPRSYARRAIFSVDEPSATIRGVNRPIAIGNAVPVKMAEFIANVIKSYMNEYD